MTLKEIANKLIKEIAHIETFCDEDGHLPEQYCHWMLNSRTQRVSEIAQGQGLSGTIGFENKGCYECMPETPICEAYKRNEKNE